MLVGWHWSLKKFHGSPGRPLVAGRWVDALHLVLNLLGGLVLFGGMWYAKELFGNRVGGAELLGWCAPEGGAYLGC